jgi:class 3 adenylate cyclase/tetratricopeptide (TPR) repeat protein
MATCTACGAQLPEGARFCPACGAPAATAQAAAEERKLATVLFADLVGSTALAEAEDPERVRARLDRFYDAMTEEIVRTGGTVESFAGDSVMAAFGAPNALEDHAERALHAALAMQRRLSELFGEALALRIGVNTGDVVIGRAREGTSFVTGDAVNVGARLEQAAAPGEVLAGERTVAAARGAFEFGDRRVVEAKGKSEGVPSRRVLRALSLMRPRGVGGMRRVFVGRESELDLLRAIFRRAVSQEEPHLVSIIGEPGLGKTRLVRELWDLLADEEPASPLRRTGRCLAYGDGITYWPLGEILKEQLGILDSDPPEEIRKRLGEREILGLALGLDVAGDLHPLDAREQLHHSVVEFVEELSAERSLVMLVEDIHWAEEDLLDLLERVVRDARGPVVLLATARPELLTRRRGWGAGRRNATTIWLEPLRSEATSRLLGELLSIELPAAIEELVVEKAEGNPFFLEELVGELVDAGVLERSDGAWRTRELPEGFSVPDSVQAVLAARIDRLPPPEKAALQAASVVGRVFWPGPVLHLLDGAEASFELLEERDFIRSKSGSTMSGEREFAIKHALTREVAYASIPKARRGRLHASLADWLERTGSAKDEHASLLAYHYGEAVRPEDADLVWTGAEDELTRIRALAVTWLRRAGELARNRYELDEAVELLTRAVELADGDRDRALLWGELGRVQALRYDGAAFWSAMHRALEGPLSREERADAYSLLAFQTSIRSGMWVTRPRREQVYEWSDRALELADEGSVARVQALLARASAEPGEVSVEVLEEASRLAELIGDPRLRSHAFGVRSAAAYDRLSFDEAAEWTTRRLELLPEIDDPDHRTEMFETAVPVIAAKGRFQEAKQHALQHWEISRRLSAHHRVHAVSLVLELADSAGDWDSIVSDTDRVVEMVEANRATPCVRNARDFLLLALAHSCLGDEARARGFERDAAPLAGEGHESSLNPPRLRLALVRGEADRVRELVGLAPFRTFVWGPSVFGTWIDALLALGEHDAIEREAPRFLQAGTVPEPFALRALGGARRDDELLARAERRFLELGLDWHAAQTERLLAGV